MTLLLMAGNLLKSTSLLKAWLTVHLFTDMPQGTLYIKHVGGPHGVQHERQGCLLQLGSQLSMFQILCLPLSCHSCSLCLCSLLLTHLLLTRNTCTHIYVEKEKKRKGKQSKGKERRGEERRGKKKERKDYTFWGQFDEKQSIIPGLPRESRLHIAIFAKLSICMHLHTCHTKMFSTTST